MDKHVLISNFDELVGMRKGVAARLRRHALRAVEAAIRDVTPRNSLKRNIRRRGSKLVVANRRIDLKKFERVLVLGAGKASIGMAEYIEEVLGDFISEGAIVAPRTSILSNLFKSTLLFATTSLLPLLLIFLLREFLGVTSLIAASTALRAWRLSLAATPFLIPTSSSKFEMRTCLSIGHHLMKLAGLMVFPAHIVFREGGDLRIDGGLHLYEGADPWSRHGERHNTWRDRNR